MKKKIQFILSLKLKSRENMILIELFLLYQGDKLSTGMVPVFPPSPIAQSVALWTLVFRTGGRWFDPRLGQYPFQGLKIVIATRFISLSPLPIVGYVGKQPVAWKEYCAEYWLKELKESIGRGTGRRDIYC